MKMPVWLSVVKFAVIFRETFTVGFYYCKFLIYRQTICRIAQIVRAETSLPRNTRYILINAKE